MALIATVAMFGSIVAIAWLTVFLIQDLLSGK
jgi:hypothetical protein